MSRIGYAPPATSDQGKILEERIRSARGDVSALYRVLLNSPAVADGWETFLTAIRNKTSLDPRLREIIILYIAVLNRAQYEFDMHAVHARGAGMTDKEIASLSRSDLDGFSGRERLVLDYASAMTQKVEVPDALFVKIGDAFDTAGVVELTATIAAYNMVSRFLVALDVR